jgi:hypothetical protein
MRAIKLDPAKLLGFKIVGSDDQKVLLTSGVLHSAKIGDKGWGVMVDGDALAEKARETTTV